MKHTGLYFLIIFFGFGLSFTAYHALFDEEEQFIQHIVQQNAGKAATMVQHALRARFITLERMATRWEDSGGTPKSQWLKDAENYYLDDPGYQALEWVDHTYHVRWIYPFKGNERAQDLNLAFEEKRKQALDQAREKRSLTMTRPIDLVQGGQGFLVYFPLYLEEKFEGFILAVFRFETLFKEIFKNQFDDYEMLLTDHGNEFYSNVISGSQNKTSFEASPFEVYGHTWHVRLNMKEAAQASLHSKTPHAALLIGMVLTLLITGLMLAIHSATQAKHQALASENQFKLAVSGTNDGIWDWFDITKDEEYWSPRFYELLGYDLDEIPATYSSFKKMIHPDDLDLMTETIDRHFKDRHPFEMEYRLKTKSGSYRWFLGRGDSTIEASTGLTRMAGSISDIHQKKNNELALKQKNEELEEINAMMFGREERMIELKQEINFLSKELGKPAPYDLGALDQNNT